MGVSTGLGLGLGEAGTSDGLELADAVGPAVAIDDGDRVATEPLRPQAVTRTINAARNASRLMLEG